MADYEEQKKLLRKFNYMTEDVLDKVLLESIVRRKADVVEGHAYERGTLLLSYNFLGTPASIDRRVVEDQNREGL